MKCVGCGLVAETNRVVIELSNSDLLGGLCVECEIVEFGQALPTEENGHSGPTSCLHEGGYALAQIELIVETDQAGTIDYLEYRLTEATPVICEYRLDSLCQSSFEQQSVMSLVNEAES